MTDRFSIRSADEITSPGDPVDICTVGQLARHLGVALSDRDAIARWVHEHPAALNEVLVLSLSHAGYEVPPGT
jgi:hypothetical protein